jgi:hypothetical protein
MQILLKHARRALEGLGDGARKSWELHVVGHSAGSIFAAHALTFLEALDISFRTIQFMAPGIRVDDFKRLVLPRVLGGSCPLPTLYVLSDRAELADTVGPYGRSLLYLVSNAFEGRRGTPILGMERYVALRPAGGGGRFPEPDGNLATLFGGTVDGRPALVVSGQEGSAGSLSRSRSHGGFDNDPDTLNSVLLRILGRRPSRPFTKRDLEY